MAAGVWAGNSSLWNTDILREILRDEVSQMPNQLYMVVERFKDAPAIYRRFRERGPWLTVKEARPGG